MIYVGRAILVSLVVAVFSAAIYAQSAKVVQISPSDATEAKQLYEAMIDADAKWAAFQKKIGTAYAKGCMFEFDQSFKFILPCLSWRTETLGGSYLVPADNGLSIIEYKRPK